MKEIIAFCFMILTAIIFGKTDANSQIILQEGEQLSINNKKGIILQTTICVALARKGDTIKSIAERYSASVILVAKLNGLFSTSRISKGREILIPFNIKEKPKGCVLPIESKYKIVRAKIGDTVKSLSCRYNVSPSEVAKLNKLLLDSRLALEQKIKIPTEQNYRCVNQIFGNIISSDENFKFS